MLRRCTVEATDEVTQWYAELDDGEKESVSEVVGLLREYGTQLGYPRSSDVKSSRHGNMRELRIQHAGKPYRILYAFDPRRVAVLLIGGGKGGDDRWYRRNVPLADRLYDQWVRALTEENP